MRGWRGQVAAFVVAGVVLLGVAPLVLDAFRLGLLAKFCCLGIVAVGIGIAWGRGGMLSLGQGAFFGLGAYVMAMHLKLADAGPDGVPDFMLLYGSGVVPAWWEPLRSPVVTVLAVLLVPTLAAGALGWAVFSRRVRGAYFSILTQAVAVAFATLLVGQQAVTGGTNGLNGFRTWFGFVLADPVNRRMLYTVVVSVLLVAIAGSWLLARSRFGELLVAVRDQENRVRFLGYDPALVKTVAFALAGMLAGVGGALFVPVVGIVSPSDVGAVASISLLVGVAIGGRATVWGPAIGTVVVNWAQSSLSEAYPSQWTYLQGALFIVVVALLPGGVASLGGPVGRAVGRLGRRGGTGPGAPPGAGPGAPPRTDDGAGEGVVGSDVAARAAGGRP